MFPEEGLLVLLISKVVWWIVLYPLLVRVAVLDGQGVQGAVHDPQVVCGTVLDWQVEQGTVLGPSLVE